MTKLNNYFVHNVLIFIWYQLAGIWQKQKSWWNVKVPMINSPYVLWMGIIKHMTDTNGYGFIKHYQQIIPNVSQLQP